MWRLGWNQDILEDAATAGREGHQVGIVILPLARIIPLKDHPWAFAAVPGKIDVRVEVLAVEGVLDGICRGLIVIQGAGTRLEEINDLRVSRWR